MRNMDCRVDRSTLSITHLAPPRLDFANMRPVVALAESRLADDKRHEAGLGLVMVTEVSA